MKILHVVTLISPDGSYGGPTTVCLSQAKELARRGHNVHVFAAGRVRKQTNYLDEQVLVTLFPAVSSGPKLGFAGLRARGMKGAIKKLGDVDVAHVHLARDLVTLPAARTLKRLGVPIVTQSHGMIDASRNPLAKILDRIWTRGVLRGAKSVLALTADEESSIRSIENAARVARIGNGVSIDAMPTTPRNENNVLFLARLHERKRPLAFVEMARVLARADSTLTFTIAGPDEGQEPLVHQAIVDYGLEGVVSVIGPVQPDQVDRLMAGSGIYVLPSVGEVFPMTVLEAFRAQTPVIVTDSLGIADDCRAFRSAIVTDGSIDELAAAVLHLRSSALVRDDIVANASRHLAERMSISGVADVLERLYQGNSA